MSASKIQNFFIVTLPGLEDLAQKEITDWFPDLATKVIKGGVEVAAPMSVGLSLNYVLKIPTRILLRVNDFSCRDFPKLFQTVSEMQWSDWIHPYVWMEAQAVAHTSRLKMKNRIEETCVAAWKAYQGKRKARAKVENTLHLFVRVNDNRCTLSLDTSGEVLHKRGARQHVGDAPLRETIAAGLLQMLSAGSQAQVELVDPMAGAGTFLLEAATRDLPIETRDFPHASFREKVGAVPELKGVRPYFKSLIGYEVDSKTLAAARRNLKVSPTPVEWMGADFMDAKPLPALSAEKSMERWVICNPPYGERLKIEGPHSEFYSKLFAQVERVCAPDRACFVLPMTVDKNLSLPKSWKIVERRKFSNGGIPVFALSVVRK